MLLLLGLVGPIVARPARAELVGRATLGYQGVDTTELSTRAFTQLYDLTVARQITSTIRCRLGMHVQDDLGIARFDGGSHDRETRMLRPEGELLYAVQLGDRPVQVQVDYARTSADTMTSGAPDLERTADRVSGRVITSPLADLTVSAEALRRGDTSRGQGLDATESTVRGALMYSPGHLTFGPSTQYTAYRDAIAGFRRHTLSAQAPIGYELAGAGWLTVQAQNSLIWTQLAEETSAPEGVRAFTRLPLASVGYAVDDTPLDSADRPISSDPGLSDDNLDTPTAITLGPTGAPFATFAADLGRFAEIDQLALHVRSATGELLLSGGNVTLSLYASSDGVLWQPIDAGTLTFDVARGRYLVDFPPTISRFFKLVAFGATNLDSFVTELEAYTHTALTAVTSRRTQTWLDQASLAMQARLGDRLTLVAYGLGNLVRQSVPGRAAFSSFDVTHNASATYLVGWGVSAEGRYDLRRVYQSGGNREDFDGVSGRLRYQPLPAITTAAGASHAAQDQSGSSSTIDAASAQAMLRILPELDLALDGGGSRQRFEAPIRQIVNRRYLSAMTRAQLTRALAAQASVGLQRSEATGAMPEGQTAAVGRDDRYFLELSYRPSQQLSLAGRFGWATGDQMSGLLQRYRADWFPFPGGAFLFGVSYDRDVQPYARQQMQRLSVFPRWAINRHAWLDASYTLSEVESRDLTTRTVLFLVTLTLNT